VRTRWIAVGCAVMMVIAIAGAVFGWVNLQRARAADEAAQRARGDAEKLIGFLIEDFYAELEPTGRLDTLGKLAHMTVKYYDGLPKELMTSRPQIYRAMALVREGAALNAHGDVDAGFKNFAEAQAVFERLARGGRQGSRRDLRAGARAVHAGPDRARGRRARHLRAVAAGGRAAQAAGRQKDSPTNVRLLYA
jgi:hypothetical protein